MNTSDPTLTDMLVSTPPREVSGQRSANRFSFQHSWGICLMLRLHQESDNDYCVLFEVHDDIVELNCSKSPTEAKFYQIKTKTTTGNWTVTKLVYRELGANRERLSSIIGNLYGQYLRFKNSVHKLVIVSNAHFKIKMNNDSESTEVDLISFTDVNDTEINKISEKLKAEYNLDSEPNGLILST